MKKIKIKKVLASFLVGVFGLLSFGCTERDPSRGQLLNEGETFKLQIWTAKDSEFLDALGKEFVVAAQTQGLSFQIVKFDSDEKLQEFLVDSLAEGTGPDIVYTDANWINQNPNKLVSLTNDESLTVSKFDSSFVRVARELLIKDGGILGVPLGIETLAVFFNEDHLVDRLESRNDPAETWEEFQKDVEKLNRSDNSFERFLVSGVALGRVDNLNYGVEILQNLMLQTGVQFFSEDQTMATFASTVGVSSEGVRDNFGEDAIRFFTSFADPRYKNFSWSEFLANPDFVDRDFETFVLGRVSMVFGKPQDVKRVEKLMNKMSQNNEKIISSNSFRVAFLPQFADPEKGNPREIFGRVRALAVPRTSENKSISWKFLKFAVREDNLRAFFGATSLPTPLLSLIPEQESDPALGKFVRQAKFARASLLPEGISLNSLEEGFEDLVNKVNSGKVVMSAEFKAFEQEVSDTLRRGLQLRKVLKGGSATNQ